MSVEPLTLNVPELLYHRLKDRAAQGNRSIEAEALAALATSVPLDDALPSYLERAVAPLAAMDEECLRRAARTELSAYITETLESLHLKQQREELTSEESKLLTVLLRDYEQVMLVRAQAAALLHSRGHDVANLLQP